MRHLPRLLPRTYSLPGLDSTRRGGKPSQEGFTLIEMMVTVGILALLAGIVINGVNPTRQIGTTRNAQRLSDISAISGAANHYAIEKFTDYPAGIDTTLRMLGTAASGCTVSCGPDTIPPPPQSITSFADNTQPEFDAGTHSNTQWNISTSAIGLTGTGLINKTGTYLSKIFDGGSSVTWNALSWLPRAPYGKELPSPFSAIETGYPTGSATMTGNVLLMHTNETSGTIADVSGNSNNGANMGGITYGVAGKFNKALSFNGTSGYAQVNTAANLNLPNTSGTVMLWINPTITAGSIPQNTGMGIIRKPDFNGNLFAMGGYSMEVYRNLVTGPANIRMYLGWNNGVTTSNQSITGATNILNNTWYHVAMTWNAGTMNIYVNGVLDGTAPRTTGPLNWAGGTEKLYIGHRAASQSTGYGWFNGSLDEIALFNRQLTAPEITAAYQRGAYDPKLRVRSCNDAACVGETFVGPDGTAGTYFSEETNTALTPATLTPNVPANRYLQYQLILDTDTQSGGPEIASVGGGNNGTGGGSGTGTATTENTLDSCLNLTSVLAPNYLTSIPFDPATGNAAKTNYAVKKIPGGLLVRSCTPALNKSIQLIQ